MKVDFIIDGAAPGGIRARHTPGAIPFTGAVASEAAAAGDADAQGGRRRGAGFSRLVGDRPQRTARAAAQGRRHHAGQGPNSPAVIEETGATAPWAGFNVISPATSCARPLSMTTQIGGEVIPSRQAGNHCDGGPAARRRRPRHRAMERAGDPGRARDRHAARLRQYGGPAKLSEFCPACTGLSARS